MCQYFFYASSKGSEICACLHGPSLLDNAFITKVRALAQYLVKKKLPCKLILTYVYEYIHNKHNCS